eukprot:138212-Pleurochrysis_carterae.AAC.1
MHANASSTCETFLKSFHQPRLACAPVCRQWHVAQGAADSLRVCNAEAHAPRVRPKGRNSGLAQFSRRSQTFLLHDMFGVKIASPL